MGKFLYVKLPEGSEGEFALVRQFGFVSFFSSKQLPHVWIYQAAPGPNPPLETPDSQELCIPIPEKDRRNLRFRVFPTCFCILKPFTNAVWPGPVPKPQARSRARKPQRPEGSRHLGYGCDSMYLPVHVRNDEPMNHEILEWPIFRQLYNELNWIDRRVNGWILEDGNAKANRNSRIMATA